MPSVVRYKNTNISKQSGERARLKVVKGPDFGTIYVVFEERAVIGRGDGSDLFITDLKASRKHAELVFEASKWVVRDLSSANGILINGKNLTSAILAAGDTIKLGETILEFLTPDVGPEVLQAPPKTTDQVARLDATAVAQQKRLAKITQPGIPKSSAKKPEQIDYTKTNADGKKKLLIAGVAAVAAILYFMQDEDPIRGKKVQTKSGKASETARSLSSLMPPQEAADIKRQAESFFHAGFREYRESNYLRAKWQFETALQIDPSHPMARRYLEKSESELSREVDKALEKGKKSLDIRKYREARGHFQSVLRMLDRDRAQPKYKEAKDQLEKINLQMKGERST